MDLEEKVQRNYHRIGSMNGYINQVVVDFNEQLRALEDTVKELSGKLGDLIIQVGVIKFEHKPRVDR